MYNTILSVLAGILFGIIYVHMFLGSMLSGDEVAAFSFKRLFNSFFRLVFITVAIIFTVFYIKLNFIWLLLGFVAAFWGMILIKTRSKTGSKK